MDGTVPENNIFHAEKVQKHLIFCFSEQQLFPQQMLRVCETGETFGDIMLFSHSYYLEQASGAPNEKVLL